MSKNPYKGKIPFHTDGKMQGYPYPEYFYFTSFDKESLCGEPKYGQQTSVVHLKDHIVDIIDGDITKVIVHVWKDNFVFEGRLKCVSYGRGRSSIKINFESLNDDKKYEMFVSDFIDKIELLKKGIFEGEFTFVKKGANYGVQFLGPKE